MKRSLHAFLATVTLAAAAHAQEAEPADPTATLTPTPAAAEQAAPRVQPARKYEPPFLLDLGGRVTFIRSGGFDPFATSDTLGQLSLGGSWEILHAGRFAAAIGARWEHGSRSAEARGAKSQLSQLRPSVAIEGRLYATPWLFGFTRLAPGIAYQRAKVEEPSAPASLVKDEWLPTGDASLGVAGLAPVTTQVKIGGSIDFGYGYVPGMKMDLKPDLPPEDPRRTASVNLKDLDASGAFLRLGVVVVF
jgi:hypothetical protein